MAVVQSSGQISRIAEVRDSYKFSIHPWMKDAFIASVVFALTFPVLAKGLVVYPYFSGLKHESGFSLLYIYHKGIPDFSLYNLQRKSSIHQIFVIILSVV